jgi:hypothetical protein
MRLIGGTALALEALAALLGNPAAGKAIPVIEVAAGLCLAAGLWTPIAGALVAASGVWSAFVQPGDPLARVLLATIGAALALIGPGAWSIDARLFGWKRIDVRDRSKANP